MVEEPKNKVDKFLSKFVLFDDKSKKIAILFVLPFIALFIYFIKPWILKTGGSWGPVLVQLGVGVGFFLLAMVVGVIAKILHKK